jgi:hypothetical protein
VLVKSRAELLAKVGEQAVAMVSAVVKVVAMVSVVAKAVPLVVHTSKRLTKTNCVTTQAASW